MSLVCRWSERGAGAGSVVGVNLRQHEAYRYVVSLPLVLERGAGVGSVVGVNLRQYEAYRYVVSLPLFRERGRGRVSSRHEGPHLVRERGRGRVSSRCEGPHLVRERGWGRVSSRHEGPHLNTEWEIGVEWCSTVSTVNMGASGVGGRLERAGGGGSRVARFGLKVGSRRTTKIKNLVVLTVLLVALILF